jgi:hypothetical protein
MAGAGMMKHTVSALVASTSTRAHRHCVCLDGHDGVGAVSGGRCLIESGGSRGSGGLSTLTTGSTTFGCGGHTGMQCGEFVHHTIVLVLLVCMDSLRVLTKVVEARELFAAVTRERPLASMFSVCVCQRRLRTESDKKTEDVKRRVPSRFFTGLERVRWQGGKEKTKPTRVHK